MTREDNIIKMNELRDKVEELVKEYNEAVMDGDVAKTIQLNEDTEKAVNEYTSIVRDMCFAECKATADPMLTAVTMLTFKTIGIKDEKHEGEKFPTRVAIGKERTINLKALDTYCGGIGADKNWMHICQKMNFLLTAQKAVDLGIDPKSVNDSYAMSEIARGFDMGKNPTSKTNLLKTLQTVVSAMLGDGYKATSHDVNFLMSVYSKKNRKALTVTCANHRNFQNYLAEVCHRIVTGKSYGIEYRRKKDSVDASKPVTIEAPADKPASKTAAAPAPKTATVPAAETQAA